MANRYKALKRAMHEVGLERNEALFVECAHSYRKVARGVSSLSICRILRPLSSVAMMSRRSALKALIQTEVASPEGYIDCRTR